MLDRDTRILRPANFPATTPGSGHSIIDICGYRFLCMNIQGTVFLDPLDNPFITADKILKSEEGRYDFALMDIHAEATSEKIAMGRYLDGRVSAVFGTHPHVQTADEQILPNGTGYITDVGMTGPVNSILGVTPTDVIEKMRTHMPHRFTVAEGDIVANGALFDIDPVTARTRAVTRIKF